jgi:ferric-dicitrate binding protein FerR (iron transport regulator)
MGEKEAVLRRAGSRRWIVLAIFLLGAGVGVGVAVATVTSTNLVDTTSVRLRIDRTHFVPSSDQPTFSSGWHTHPGPVIIQVQEGYLKITQATCHPNVIGPGETYIETAELPVVATANQEASWTATLIVPAGAPLRTNASDPC